VTPTLASDLAFRDGGFPKATARVVPASNFHALAAVVLEVRRLLFELGGVSENEVEHALGIGLHVTAKAAEVGVDCFAVFLVEILEQDVVAVGERREEVPLLARLPPLRMAGNGLDASAVASVEMQNAVPNACRCIALTNRL
jgi:hypothetical protein